MRRIASLVVALSLAPAAARAEVAGGVAATPAPRHANPRLKLSYRRFSIASLDGSPLWLDGAQLDMYALSRRWVRIGLELEGGAGHADLAGNGVSVGYGLGGVTLGLQYPARVTPFIEGRAIGGALGGRFDRAIGIPGTSVTIDSVSALTWIYGGGVETGIELYTFGRAYLSASIGWVRTTWRGIAFPVTLEGVRAKDIESDSFTFKLGFGV
jgi:hypothetical protein